MADELITLGQSL